MQLTRLAEVPVSDRDRVFGYSRGRALFGTAILLIAAIGAAILSWAKQVWLGYYISAAILLTLFIFRKMVSARFGPSNWLVRLAASDRLHIEWHVVPNAQSFLDALSRHSLVRPTEHAKKDFVDLAGLSRAEQETCLLELAESGDKIGAIALARKLYSYDLTAAKDFVEGLASKKSP